jgi:hypothetical protein
LQNPIICVINKLNKKPTKERIDKNGICYM